MIGELTELFAWIQAGFAGWRFMFSSNYRERIFARWSGASRWAVLWDVVCGTAGVLFTVGLICLLAVGMLSSRR